MTRTRKITRGKRRAKVAPAASGSVVGEKYRSKYKDGSCGDDIATQLKERCTKHDGTIDRAKLKAIADVNGVWNERWGKLNSGLARMSCGNKLRALARRGNTIRWGRP